MKLRNFRVELEYDGTDFCGWQVQPEVRTIQREVERALYLLTHEEIRVHGAGRTDSGVHALGQVISFRCSTRIDGSRLFLGLNRFLPPDIWARRSSAVSDDFHARISAVGKTYGYTALIHRGERPLVARYAAPFWPEPDIDKMKASARMLVGEHDFAAFAASGRKPGPTVREVRRITIEPVPGSELPGPLGWGTPGELATPALRFVVTGNGFLYKMVRNIVGALIEVGQGKMPAHQIEQALATGERELCGSTAPAKGLAMVGVDYPDVYQWQ